MNQNPLENSTKKYNAQQWPTLRRPSNNTAQARPPNEMEAPGVSTSRPNQPSQIQLLNPGIHLTQLKHVKNKTHGFNI